MSNKLPPYSPKDFETLYELHRRFTDECIQTSQRRFRGAFRVYAVGARPTDGSTDEDTVRLFQKALREKENRDG